MRAASEDLRAAEHVHRERRGRAQGVPAQRRRCDRELHRAQPLIALPCVIRNFAWLKWSCGRRKLAGKSVGILAGAACRHTKRKQGCTIETWVAIGGLRGSEAHSRRYIRWISRIVSYRGIAHCKYISHLLRCESHLRDVVICSERPRCQCRCHILFVSRQGGTGWNVAPSFHPHSFENRRH